MNIRRRVVKRLLQWVEIYFLRQLLLRRFPDRPQFRIRVLRLVYKAGRKPAGEAAAATGQPEAGQKYEQPSPYGPLQSHD